MKQKKIFIGLASLVAAVGFTACSSDDADFLQRSSTGKVISLTSAMGMRGTSDPQASQLSTSVHVGVFAVTNETTPALISNGNNNEHTVSGTNLVTTSAMTWPTTEGTKVNFYAYAPYQSTWIYNTANTFSVATDQSDNDGYIASDLVYGIPATNPVEETDAAIPLTFTHKMAQIAVTIKKQEGAPDLTGATVTIVNTKTETTFNPSTGEVPAEATGSTTQNIKAAELTAEPDATTGTTIYAAIAPQTISAGTALVKIVTAGNKTLIAKIGTSDVAFASGKAYTFTVNVGAITADVTTITLSTSSTAVTEWGTQGLGADNLYATFGTAPSNASYSSPFYSWNASSNNLVSIFEFSNGELASYKTLSFTINNMTEGAKVRIRFDKGNDNLKQLVYSSNGRYIIDLEKLEITLADVTKITFGGNTSDGSCQIDASDVFLSTLTFAELPAPYMYSTFYLAKGGNCIYNAPTFEWTNSSDNLLTVFEFSNGELANCSTLYFTFAEISGSDKSIRIIFDYNDDTNITKYFAAAGIKTVTLSELSNEKELSDIKSIRLGGNSSGGKITIKASEMYIK